MAFSVEKIETPEQRAEFNSFGFMRPGTKMPSEALTWIVDRFRGVFLVNLGGGSLERPYFFRLIAPNDIDVRFEGTLQTDGDIGAGGLEVWWRISEMRVHHSQKNRIAEIGDWIREGLKVYGALGSSQHTKVVHVELPIASLVEVLK